MFVNKTRKRATYALKSMLILLPLLYVVIFSKKNCYLNNKSLKIYVIYKLLVLAIVKRYIFKADVYMCIELIMIQTIKKVKLHKLGIVPEYKYFRKFSINKFIASVFLYNSTMMLFFL